VNVHIDRTQTIIKRINHERKQSMYLAFGAFALALHSLLLHVALHEYVELLLLVQLVSLM